MGLKTEYSVSIVMPVKNGGKTLNECLRSIHYQKGILLKEIIILDSGSTDNSLEIASSFGATIIPIDPVLFNHGLTRNVGVNAAAGDLIYLTVQDAAISEHFMLERMVSHFHHPEVKAVVGIQGARQNDNTNPAIWFKRSTAPFLETIHFPDGSFSKLSKAEQLTVNSWDNVNAMYRKTALVEISFKETSYCEDKIWADEALHNGWKLLRDSSLLVYHYHHMYFSYMVSQKYIVDFFNYNRYSCLPEIPNIFMSMLKRIWGVIKKDELNLLKKTYWIYHNIMALIAELWITLLFRILHSAAGRNGLQRGYKQFCSKVPQGSRK